MLVLDDTLDIVLLGCFLFGLVFSALSLLFGDLGIGGDGSAGEAGAGGDGVPLVNLSTILAFVAWFGGVGYLVRRGAEWSAPVSVVVGVAGGVAGAAAVAWFLRTVVAPNDRALDPADYRLPGTVARVTSSIRAGGTGEIVYEQAGVRQVSAARAADGQAISHGAEVVVVRAQGGVAVVEPSAVFFDGDPVLIGAAATLGADADLQRDRERNRNGRR